MKEFICAVASLLIVVTIFVICFLHLTDEPIQDNLNDIQREEVQQ